MENISLPLKHHGQFSDSEILSLLERFALSFKDLSFLKLRPYQADPGQLKLAQWIRLFIGSPQLILLQNPAQDTPPVFLREIELFLRKFLNEGGGILYLNTSESIVFESLITKRYSLSQYESIQNSEETS